MLPIDEHTRQRIRASFAPFLADRERFAQAFYDRLFEAAPHLRSLFPDDLSGQRRKLVDMLVVVIDAGIGGPSVRLLEELGARHIAYGAREEHYVLVHETLLATLRSAGAPLDLDTERAWSTLLHHVIDAMQQGATQATNGSAPLELLVNQPVSGGSWIVRDEAAGRTLFEHETRERAEAAAIRFAETASRRGRTANLLFQHENGAVVRFKIGG